MTYTPHKGSTAERAITYLKGQGEGASVSSAVLADALDIDPQSLSGMLETPVKHGLLRKGRSVMDARIVVYSLGDGTPLEQPTEDAPIQRIVPAINGMVEVAHRDPTPPFATALYDDGRLLIEQGDHRVILAPEHTDKLVKFLGRVALGEAV